MTEHLYAHFQETDHMLEPSSQGSYHNGFRHLLYSPHFASRSSIRSIPDCSFCLFIISQNLRHIDPVIYWLDVRGFIYLLILPVETKYTEHAILSHKFLAWHAPILLQDTLLVQLKQ